MVHFRSYEGKIMSTNREILVAIDHSEFANRVVDHSCELAKELSARILLLHVEPNDNSGPDEGFGEYTKTEHQRNGHALYMQARSETVLEEQTHRIRERGIEFETILEKGNPVSGILKVVKLRKPRVVVVGLVGYHGFGRVRALGSVSRGVIERSPIPVVTVPI